MPGWIDNIIAKFSAGDDLPWTDEDMIAVSFPRHFPPFTFQFLSYAKFRRGCR